MAKLCFGGTFNPIHAAHLICARHVAERLNFEQVVLIPNAQPPHKQPGLDLAAAADRLRMSQLAAEGRAGFEVSDIEARQTELSYTVDTARELTRQGWTKVTWLIGADMVRTLPNWHEPQALIEEVDFVVMGRPGWEFDWESMPVAFRKLRDRVVEAPMIDVSATEIRRRVRENLPIDFLTPEPVVRYIHDRGLYRRTS